MNKKYMLWIFVLILLSSFGSAIVDLTVGNNFLYVVNDTTNITTSNGDTCIDYDSLCDKSGRTSNLTTGDTVEIKSDGYFEFDGATENLDTLYSLTNISRPENGDFTLSLWINPNTFATQYDYIVDTGGGTTGSKGSSILFGAGLGATSDIAGAIRQDSKKYVSAFTATSLDVGKWYNVILSWDKSETRMTLFINNTVQINQTSSVADTISTISNLRFCERISTGASNCNSKMQGLAGWGKVLNSEERTEILDNNKDYNFYIPTVSNESLEATVFQQQQTPVVINSPNYINVLGGNTTPLFNNTKGYLVLVSSINTTANSIAQCRVLVDGVEVATTIKDNLAGETSSITITTEEAVFENKSYDLDFECKRNTGQAYTLFNTIGVGHLLKDNLGRNITSKNISVSNTTTSSSFVKIANYTITTGAFISDETIESIYVIDWYGKYTNNAGVDEQSSLFIEVEGERNCSVIPRYTPSGDTSSVSSNCIIENLSASTTYSVNVWANGTNTDFNLTVHNKNFYADIEEFASVDLTGINITDTTLTNIFNFSINNSNHNSTNMFMKAGIPVKSNNGTGLVMFKAIVVDGSYNESSSTYVRTVEAGYGVTNAQYSFENLPQDDYIVQIWASCSTGNCTIGGGEIVAYLTDTQPVTLNVINFTAFDEFDNSTINSFTIFRGSDNATFTTTNGFVSISQSEIISNFTVISSGYFNRTYNNINITLNQSINASLEMVNGRIIINEKVRTQAGNFTIDSFQVNVIGLNNSYAANFTTTNGNITVTVPRSATNLTYNLTFIPTGFEFTSRTFLYANETFKLFNETLYFFGFNSIGLNFYDTNTLNLLNGTNVTVQFIGASAFSNITDSGSLFVNLLNPSEYTIVFSAPGYQTGNYIFTLVNGTTNAFNIYMELINDTSLVLITIKDRASKDPIPNAEVTIQKYINNAWVTDQIVKTDFNGQTEAYFKLSTRFYNFLVEFEGIVFFGVVNSNENKKVIYAEDVANGIVIEIETSPDDTIQTYQTIYDVVTEIDFIQSDNSSGIYLFTFDNTNNLPVNATLNVYVNGVLNCTNNVISESGGLLCAISVDNTSLSTVTAEGFIGTLSVETRIDILGNSPETNLDWSFKGFMIGVFLTLIFYWGTSKSPAVSLMTGTVVVVLLILTKVIFPGTDVTLLVVMLFAAFLLGRIPSKSGVNA